MRPELRKEILRILGKLADPQEEQFVLYVVVGDPAITREAIGLLRSLGALSEVGTGAYRITIPGYDYYEKLNAPRRHWLSNNWFPVSVLVLSSVVTLGSSLIVVLLSS